MKKTDIHIGCSAFNNGYWKPIFYPEGLARSKWFDYYCSHFNTYEINATFYKFPTDKSMEAWYRKSPEGFLFSVKANRLITHFRRFRECREEIDRFYSICNEGLKEKLGPVLFQFPPSFDFSEEKLELIISNLNPGFRNVIEFRHRSWWIPEVYEKLAEHHICCCGVSYPLLPEILPSGPRAYIRLHGVPKLFYSGYTAGELQQWRDRIFDDEERDEVFIYFNNTASAEGILNALEMKRILRS
jgi:uncharacterized protein YecE (DUF72 family)